MFEAIRSRGGYYDDEGLLRFPEPEIDRSRRQIDERTRRRRDAMVAAAAATAISPEEVQAYAEMDPSGTYETQSADVQQRIEKDIDHVIAASHARGADRAPRIPHVERERALAMSVHGHSTSRVLTAPLPPLALPDEHGEMKPVSQVDPRVLGKAGVVVLQESDVFHSILRVVVSVQQGESPGGACTLEQLEGNFLKHALSPVRHLADFIEGRSVVGNRRALLARVSYSFHAVGMYYVCFFMRLTEASADRAYLGKDPFVCSTGWAADSRIVPVFFRCTCK
jgi:hypothetical protein